MVEWAQHIIEELVLAAAPCEECFNFPKEQREWIQPFNDDETFHYKYVIFRLRKICYSVEKQFSFKNEYYSWGTTF